MSTNLAIEREPSFTVWLVGAGDRDAQHLPRLAVYAITSGDAVIHDDEIAEEVLDLLGPPQYLEATASQAKRIRLARCEMSLCPAWKQRLQRPNIAATVPENVHNGTTTPSVFTVVSA